MPNPYTRVDYNPIDVISFSVANLEVPKELPGVKPGQIIDFELPNGNAISISRNDSDVDIQALRPGELIELTIPNENIDSYTILISEDPTGEDCIEPEDLVREAEAICFIMKSIRDHSLRLSSN